MATRILINTDSATVHSGLAETTRNIFIPLLKMFPGKYEIHQKGWWHRQTDVQQYWPIHPTNVIETPQGPQHDREDTYGRKTLIPLIEKLQPDIVFAYGDLWTFDFILNCPIREKFRLCVLYTVDGYPYYGSLDENGGSLWGPQLATADALVTLSEFGRDVLKASCPELADKEIHVRSHPIDLDRFSHLPDKKEVRSEILPPEYSDSFIFGWLGRNQFRKQNYKLWEILHYLRFGDYILCKDCDRVTIKEWNLCRRRTKDPSTGCHSDRLTMYEEGYDYTYCYWCKSRNILNGTPRKVNVWFHMPKTDPAYDATLHSRAWKVDDVSLYTDGVTGLAGVPQSALIKIMRSWDALLYPTGGEGLGNPVHEALACELPIVYSDYSSHAENARHAGIPIKGPFVSEQNNCIQRMAVDLNSAVRACLRMMDMPEEERLEMGKRGKEYISRFALERMAPEWDFIFDSIMKAPKKKVSLFNL
ncbi:MAG: glycosyltransferase family 1 protein [Gammaproteobacteria bacterium]|nr:MAG: glycosyltransferase family 1 protein [Gammaproteobacteria bacterium]